MENKRIIPISLVLVLGLLTWLPAGLFPWHSFSVTAAAPPVFQAPPLAKVAAPHAAPVFQVTWDSQCDTPSDVAQATVEAAAAEWGKVLISTVPIHVTACWTTTPCDSEALLGCGSATKMLLNFPRAPLADTYYPIALANALARQDLNTTGDEIKIELRSNVNYAWLSTTLKRVAMHEIGHGLGFFSGMYEDANLGYCGDGYYGLLYQCPAIYDRFLVDSSGTKLLDLMTGDRRNLGTRLKSDASFGGPKAIAANGGSPVKLYAPGTFSMSSVCHLDEVFNNTVDGLMTPTSSLNSDEIGPVTLALLHDLGWPTSSEPFYPLYLPYLERH
jgi:hypothetical protein